MNTNENIIRDFVTAWSRLDVKELSAFFTDDGCYHNMPLQPAKGRENVEQLIAGFLSTWTETEWEIINIASSGDIVIVERIDKTKTTAGNVDLPCVGVFELENGKIKEWRDYFDMATYAGAMKA
ncbi:MAG: limonene-1,2-epoxide hydrolase [Gammaproteobacteria bacterium]|nr:MAG: limonene-1,2-epoxide hydrolase [Gammaproteobacteria bacterium]RLA46428.1 MAG: limonene-1,2-epoxide hydrolase [Gammaproteobacteria bacterium]